MKRFTPTLPPALAVIALALVASQNARASTDDLWQQFHSDPSTFMSKTPPKTDAAGSPVPAGADASFSRKDIVSKRFVEKKADARLGRNGYPFSARVCNREGVCLDEIKKGRVHAGESLDDFLDPREFTAKGLTVARTLKDLEERKLLSAQLPAQPWSSSYWPIISGSIAARYASDGFRTSGSQWKTYYDFVKHAEPLSTIYRDRDPAKLEELSPSEKYDLLIGDLSEPEASSAGGYLTPILWNEGQRYNERYGSVEGWMGLCHGWAPASFMVPSAKSVVSTKAADGNTTIAFYPDDIKALATHLWAVSNPSTSFVGGRCDSKDPERDPESGRILDDACFDVSPATFHFALANQIGQAKRSFVMDATYDYEVWNQPVFSYQFEYFNPETGERFESFEKAKISISEFGKDTFKKFRDPAAKDVVGVHARVTYVTERSANHFAENSEERREPNTLRTVGYIYDLELDASGEVTGGEWYSNSHPDFLWLPTFDAVAQSPLDSAIGRNETWTTSEPIPKFWRDIAIVSATKLGQPLSAIITPLAKKAAED